LGKATPHEEAADSTRDNAAAIAAALWYLNCSPSKSPADLQETRGLGSRWKAESRLEQLNRNPH
jgi:hypothetical protein